MASITEPTVMEAVHENLQPLAGTAQDYVTVC
jgi:hypothetical protein